jgi:hypothetical protein
MSLRADFIPALANAVKSQNYPIFMGFGLVSAGLAPAEKAQILLTRSRRKENVVSVNLQEFFGGIEFASTYGCVTLNTPVSFGYP